MLVKLLLLMICCHNLKAEVSVISLLTRQIEQEFADAESLFGGVVPVDGIKGLVVYANPEDGCTKVNKPPYKHENIFGKWILLIKRHNCNFDVKVRNAQEAGYDVAIVHNVNSSDIQPMGGDHPFDIFIPSVFIGSDAGDTIKELYLYNEQYFLSISMDRSNDLTMQLLMIFAILIGICFFIMVGFVIYKYIKDRRRAMRHRLPKSSLKQIPILKYKKSDPYEMCAICLEEYKEGEKLRVLPCLHAYHMVCIDPWLTKNRRVCPVCKRRVLAGNGTNQHSDDSELSEDEHRPLLRNSNATRSNPSGHQTFITQPENPFQRARRHFLQRTESISSSLSSLSEPSTSATPSMHSTRAEVEETRSLIEEPSVNA